MAEAKRADRELDQSDRRILRALQENARLTVAQVAEKAGLSQTPCWNRLKRLESSGVISGYVALVDQAKIGYPETVIIEVTLERHDEEALKRFGDILKELPEVIEAYLTTGEYDYFIKVAVSGTAGYERFLREKLYRIPGIRHSRSAFTLRCLKHQPSFQV